MHNFGSAGGIGAGGADDDEVVGGTADVDGGSGAVDADDDGIGADVDGSTSIVGGARTTSVCERGADDRLVFSMEHPAVMTISSLPLTSFLIL